MTKKSGETAKQVGRDDIRQVLKNHPKPKCFGKFGYARCTPYGCKCGFACLVACYCDDEQMLVDAIREYLKGADE